MADSSVSVIRQVLSSRFQDVLPMQMSMEEYLLIILSLFQILDMHLQLPSRTLMQPERCSPRSVIIQLDWLDVLLRMLYFLSQTAGSVAMLRRPEVMSVASSAELQERSPCQRCFQKEPFLQ